MEIAVPHAAHGVLVVAVEVDEGFEAVFLTGVEEPVNGPFLVGFAVVLEEVGEKIFTERLSGGVPFFAQSFGHEFQVFLQGVFTVDSGKPIGEAAYHVIIEIGFVGDGDDVVFVGTEGLVFCTVPLSPCIGQARGVQGVAAQNAAYAVGNEGTDIPSQVRLSHRHILVFLLRRQFVLQTVDMDENTVQLFLIPLELLETVFAFFLPLGKGFFQCAHGTHQRMTLEIPGRFKGVPVCP